MTREKTKTIKERQVNIYLPSVETKENWKEIADEHGLSLSKFVQKMVREGIERIESEDDLESRVELIKKNKELSEEVRELTKELQRYKKLADRQEKELREHRAQPFLEENFEGEREIPSDLVNILKKKKKVRYENLHNHLGITPGDDASMALQSQLKILEAYGLVERDDNFLRWTG